MAGTHIVIFSQWSRQNIVTKRDAEVLLYETKLVKKSGLKKHFWTLAALNLEKDHFLQTWRSCVSAEEAEVCLPDLTRNFHSSIHGHTCAAVYVYSPHVQAGVSSGRNTFREGSAGAETHLGEEDPYQNSMTTAPAPSSSPRVGYTRNCWEAAEPACEKRLLRKKIFRRYWFQEREC